MVIKYSDERKLVIVTIGLLQSPGIPKACQLSSAWFSGSVSGAAQLDRTVTKRGIAHGVQKLTKNNNDAQKKKKKKGK